MYLINGTPVEASQADVSMTSACDYGATEIHTRSTNRETAMFNLSEPAQVAVNHAQSISRVVESLGTTLPTMPQSCDPDAVNALYEVDQLIAWAEAQRQILLLACVGTAPQMLRKVEKHGSKSVSDIRAVELAALTKMSPNSCFNQVHTARTLLEEVPTIFRAMLEGKITHQQNRIILEGVRELRVRFSDAQAQLSAKTLTSFCERVLWRVERRTLSELRRIVRDTVLRLAPLPDRDLSASVYSERGITLDPAPHGMAYLTAYISAEDASATWQVLNQAARCDTSLNGSQANRMADAFVSIISGKTEMSPEQRNAAAEIQVLVYFDNLVSIANGEKTPLVGEISTTGLMLESSAIHRLLNDARFRRILVEPTTGRLLDFGRETYRPPTHLRQAVKARDLTCRAPGCVRPARYCDLDHIESWDSGGETRYDNLAALCRTHHLLKTHGNWSYQLLPNGTTQWQLPNGTKIERHPAQISLRNQSRPDQTIKAEVCPF